MKLQNASASLVTLPNFMNYITNEDYDSKIHDYFTGLGYKITWDFSKKTGEFWYEIYKDDTLVSQIDMNVDLKYIIQDLCDWHEGKEASSTSPDYKICGEGKLFKEFLKKVYDNRNK